MNCSAPLPGTPVDDRTDGRLAKVRKLLAKAEDPGCTPEEAEAFNAKASELIAAYGIDQVLLSSNESPSAVGDRTMEMDAPYAREKADLLATVANSLGCRSVILITKWPSTSFAVRIFGFAADLERAELLFTGLLLQSTSQLVRTLVPEWDHPAAFRRTWLAGFTSSIARRLRKSERQAQEGAADWTRSDGRSVSLVLADRSRLVDRAIEQEYPRLTTGRRRQLSGTGYGAGLSAGERADLGTSRVGGGRRPGLGR